MDPCVTSWNGKATRQPSSPVGRGRLLYSVRPRSPARRVRPDLPNLQLYTGFHCLQAVAVAASMDQPSSSVRRGRADMLSTC